MRVVHKLWTILISSVAVAGGLAAAPENTTTPPKLAVLISIDQGRADYLERFRPWFGQDGFARLLEEGRVYTECRYRHAVTFTAPGHATIATGTHANLHGIIANDWLIPAEGEHPFEQVNSVEDRDSAIVGLEEQIDVAPLLLNPKTGRSPRHLLMATIGDQLKLRYGDRSRVISVSGKDRAAILMGGHYADGAYWRKWGRMVSSTYYGETLPEWVSSFNATRSADEDFGRVWAPVMDPALYDEVQGPDVAAGETKDSIGLGVTLPKTIDGGLAVPGLKFYQAYAISPFAVPQLLDFALAAVDAEKLGQRDAPDLLCVGISQPDKMGHYYGPDSHEMMDSIIRLDAELARFFGALDERVGRGNYVVVLTADHGVAPLPERVQGMHHHGHLHAGRLDGSELETAVQAALEARYGVLPNGAAWFERDHASFRLTPSALAGRDAAELRKVVRAAVLGTNDIADAWTREQLLAITPQGNDLISLVRRSYHEGRGPDVFYVHQPYVFEREQGTTHGDPYHYDRHVPLIWWGAGIPGGQVADPVGVDDLALTLAGLLQIDGPPRAEGQRLF